MRPRPAPCPHLRGHGGPDRRRGAGHLRRPHEHRCAPGPIDDSGSDRRRCPQRARPPSDLRAAGHRSVARIRRRYHADRRLFRRPCGAGDCGANDPVGSSRLRPPQRRAPSQLETGNGRRALVGPGYRCARRQPGTGPRCRQTPGRLDRRDCDRTGRHHRRPAKLGANELHLYALTKQGASRPVEAISATLSNTGAGVERLESRTVRAGPNHLQALSLDLPLAGTWRVDVSVKLDAFTERADERRSPFADPGLVPCEPSRRVPGRHHPTSAVRASQTSCFGPRNGQKHRMWDGEHRHVGFRARLLMPGTPLETGIRRPTQRAVASSHALG